MLLQVTTLKEVLLCRVLGKGGRAKAFGEEEHGAVCPAQAVLCARASSHVLQDSMHVQLPELGTCLLLVTWEEFPVQRVELYRLADVQILG